MARGVTGWLGAAVGGCLLVGAVYLPPRGLPRWAWEGRKPAAEESEPRLRARGLAQEWRTAYGELVGARYREQLSPVLAARRAAEVPGPVLMVRAPDSLRHRAERELGPGLDSGWARLGLGVTKISVGVVLAEGPVLQSSPATVLLGGPRGGLTYLLPDSADRATCLVVGSLPYFVTHRKYLTPDRVAEWARGALGPCAYYARFGVPSQRIRRWLGRRNYDLAMSAGWNQPASDWIFAWVRPEEKTGRWWWRGIYTFPFPAVACFAGRAAACRWSLVAGDAGAGATIPTMVVSEDAWDRRKIRLIGGHWFLSEVVRATDEERFQEFWTTSLPVDSALTVALNQPVGEWTVGWFRRIGPPPPLGAAPGPLDALLGVGTGVLALGLLVLGQTRREVQ